MSRSKPSRARMGPENTRNPPETSAHVAPLARMVRTSARAPGMMRMRAAAASRTEAGRPRRSATRSASAARKSISPFMARRVMAATCSLTPAKSASSSSISFSMMVDSRSLTRSFLRRPAAGLRHEVDRAPVERRARGGSAGFGRDIVERQVDRIGRERIGRGRRDRRFSRAPPRQGLRPQARRARASTRIPPWRLIRRASAKGKAGC